MRERGFLSKVYQIGVLRAELDLSAQEGQWNSPHTDAVVRESTASHSKSPKVSGEGHRSGRTGSGYPALRGPHVLRN